MTHYNGCHLPLNSLNMFNGMPNILLTRFFRRTNLCCSSCLFVLFFSIQRTIVPFKNQRLRNNLLYVFLNPQQGVKSNSFQQYHFVFRLCENELAFKYHLIRFMIVLKSGAAIVVLNEVSNCAFTRRKLYILVSLYCIFRN